MDIEMNNSESFEETSETKNTEPQEEEIISLSLSQRLNEIIKLMQPITKKLEELSIERRTQVSQKQWAALEEYKSSSKSLIKPIKFWQKSLFSRTYFIDKDFDEMFRNIMKYNSMFNEHLSNFNSKVQSCGDGVIENNFENVKTQPIDNSETTQSAAIFSTKQPEKASSTTDINISSDEPDFSWEDVKAIRQSLTDLIRAKINFDTEFHNFNANLSKNYYSENFHCLYEIFGNSNVVLEKTSLSTDKRRAFGSDKRRKHLTQNAEEKSRKRLRRSRRIAANEDLSEVQVIRSFGQRETSEKI